MAMQSSIEWTESTWNPLTGCTKISPGCKNCYAERMSRRLKAMGNQNYRNGFELTLHEHVLGHPLRWKKPQMIFVNSMSDLLHDDVPLDFIHQVFEVMNQAHWHTFQVLTKRSARLLELDSEIDWPDNVWMGVSVETQAYASRVEHLRETNAHIKFLSLEPLLGPLILDLTGINWAIVGGESGPKSRPMKEEWVQSIRQQCQAARVPFFFKQWGGECARSKTVACSMGALGMRCPLLLMLPNGCPPTFLAGTASTAHSNPADPASRRSAADSPTSPQTLQSN